MAARVRPLVSTLRFSVHVYEEHSWVSVSRVVDLPFVPDSRRLGSRRLNVGRAALTGLDTAAVVRLIAAKILEE